MTTHVSNRPADSAAKSSHSPRRRPMFRRVVLALDGSPDSQITAADARAITARLAGEVIVLHLREIIYSGAAVWSPESFLAVHAVLDDVVESLRSEGLRARRLEFDAPHGHIGRTIAEIADREKADLLILGSPHFHLPGLFGGDVASRAAHFATCPVLILKGPSGAGATRVLGG
jgi:nucleotide-binding universal stress UspA family protein